MTGFLMFIHVVACVLLILVVLVQPDRGDGMAGAFGGMGGSVAFGVKTLDVLWKITVGLAAAFMLTALALTYLDKGGNRIVPAPVASPVPASPPDMPAPAAPAPTPAPAGP